MRSFPFMRTDLRCDAKTTARAQRRFKVAALLSNARCCLYGNSTSLYFACQPPSLERYFI
eukprot:m.79135 g.79135  ORF g.79135 m.79135 type:complete len:60 (+) comp14779_c0_seq1:1646-1825(+)